MNKIKIKFQIYRVAGKHVPREHIFSINRYSYHHLHHRTVHYYRKSCCILHEVLILNYMIIQIIY